VYSPFFQTLHDEPSPVGILGRGTHYSILRAVTWHDALLQRLPKAQLLDFAVIWDEDHDTRVMMVVEAMYFDGLLAPVKFIGERKGGLNVLVAEETAANLDLSNYEERIKDAFRHSGIGDWWNVDIAWAGDRSGIINAASEKVEVYLQNIDNLWALGTKPRPEPASPPESPDHPSLDDDSATGEFCQILAPGEISSTFRRWCGDDEKGVHRHHGAVPLSESPVDIELSWRESENSATVLIGRYRLDLHALLSEGYIRRDSKPGHIRLQFVHDGDDIYIQHRPEKRLRVGVFSTNQVCGGK
jgi:hypothetical protein